MMRYCFGTAILMLGLVTFVAAQTPIRVLRFDNGAGVIDHGENANVYVGEIFEVNRYDGDFVYWVGRVKVYAVRPKVAAVKMLAKAANANIQKGDVLEPQHEASGSLLGKLETERTTPGIQEIRTLPPEIDAEHEILSASDAPQRLPIIFNFATGGVYSLPGTSRSMGMNLTLQVIDRQNRVTAIDMSRAYTNGVAVQAGFSLPLMTKFSLDLNYSYLALQVRNTTESQLLRFGLKATASLVQINGVMNYHFAPRWEVGAGTGLYLPQVKVEGNSNSASLAERQWGWMLSCARLFPVNRTVWVKVALAYNLFLDNGPAVHYFALHFGPSFTMGR